MAVLDAFMAIWSKARGTFGDGVPQDGSVYDASPALTRLQDEVRGAAPRETWTGSASDGYASANERHASVLGETALLDRRLRAEIDRSAEVVRAGRRELDAVRRRVSEAAAGVPPTPEGESMLYPAISRGSGEIVDIVQRSHTDLNMIAGRIEAIASEYQALGEGTELGVGDGAEPAGGAEPGDEPRLAVSNENEPWTYPFDPPAPPDSAPGGGRWELGQAYPPGPGGGPPMGPIPAPKPWHRSIDPPVKGGGSGLEDVVTPPPNGVGVRPPLVLQESYEFRVTGEGFRDGDGHLRWIQRDGSWYQAQWIDYELEANHLQQLTGNVSVPLGDHTWEPIDIKDIYQLQVDNPRLTLYIPDPSGSVLELDPDRPAASGP
ncbi:EspA/EspE family type VII secretion system effector [Mycolicibacterium sp. jd]|uniref:ESX-1 secretion-associated protein EspA/EspE-like domain-containing protein n=1 Tax=Mycolicibacterium vanbaalenii (strain DSM 7251 / JCM 13017 / BCRC 16820 / KCTC 9966 / NRRL B-24157 / PYR-1) TaxID=350058 RepID=A1TCD7_MYCVP|nr:MULTISPECIES: EspA/EspE family type VII secretion system effector [Mycolicibacterium]ABM14837.1 hypothetical protein Mvan_4060 [Mycolicibacterium vanbaalenii PYR-1]PQP43368.1 hypothetical protein C6A88_24470 [Mycolicibacterium austroafricanum]UJL28276.1 hypothetical protein HZU38_26095 [Mycolicibacterium vanbaalenii]WND54969.1 EspA/EspE family type VII secretion system effector [Mycolicibacterium vanbaalenii]